MNYFMFHDLDQVQESCFVCLGSGNDSDCVQSGIGRCGATIQELCVDEPHCTSVQALSTVHGMECHVLCLAHDVKVLRVLVLINY